jgi:hypothetical protein
MDKAFKDQIGRNLEVYVDDLVIKSQTEADRMKDIQETFDQLRSIWMKLNPKKCSFGMEVGQFFGVMVTKEGFKVNPDKVRAVIEMPSPSTLKEVQSLNGRLAALNRFLAQHAERSIPFISTLRKCLTKSLFQWT